jgi:hypothetical protein
VADRTRTTCRVSASDVKPLTPSEVNGARGCRCPVRRSHTSRTRTRSPLLTCRPTSSTSRAGCSPPRTRRSRRPERVEVLRTSRINLAGFGAFFLPSPRAGEGDRASRPGEGCARRSELAEWPSWFATVHPSPGQSAARPDHPLPQGERAKRNHPTISRPTWNVTSAPRYASAVMYAKVNAGHAQLFVSRLMTASVAAH